MRSTIPTIRWIDDDHDCQQIEAISKECFPPASVLDRDEVARLASQSERGYVVKVIEIRHPKKGRKVVGYLVYRLYPRSLVLVQLAVSKAFRRRGLGTTMVAELVKGLPLLRRWAIGTEVPEENLEAQLFFRKLGFAYFRTTRTRRGALYYAMRYLRPAEQPRAPAAR